MYRRGLPRYAVTGSVLFTDIVESTKRAADAGDATWRRLLEQHDALVLEEVAAAGGRVVKSLGDGVLAVFAGPARRSPAPRRW